MKKIFEIMDGIREEQGKISAAWNEKQEISQSLMIGWIDKNTELLMELAKKVEELQERLDAMKTEK